MYCWPSRLHQDRAKGEHLMPGSLDSLLPRNSLNFGSPRKRRQKRDIANSQEPPRPSLVGKIGSTAVGGLSAVGNALDLALGASSVRDALAGENPFDQFLTP